MKNHIPKHKSDMAAVARLQALPFDAVRQDAAEILECIQDMHWDIGRGVADYLAPHVNEIKAEILWVLNSSDDVWEFNVIRSLLAYSDKPLDAEIVATVKRFAEQPTEDEVEHSVDWAAQELLKNKFLCG